MNIFFSFKILVETIDPHGTKLFLVHNADSWCSGVTGGLSKLSGSGIACRRILRSSHILETKGIYLETKLFQLLLLMSGNVEVRSTV